MSEHKAQIIWSRNGVDFGYKNYSRNHVWHEAIGHLEKNADGKLAVTRVELRPKIAFGGNKQPTQADLDWMHDKAHRECFISNSALTSVTVT